ncbi:hypothetical protein [Bacillus sp. 7884-1]|uniref:hypothetical protein n=1 Tax=Bacillus sp. 7884-1 TaxID=2021693 RepID=UPI000BA78122|nr:hypothetical protein [Bacillus sp. 7884-1]PAE33333.1 hypothetical protein CHI06_26125 [Bacillus sp. 7884-1]
MVLDVFISQKKHVKVKVYHYNEDSYVATATDGERTVCECYGSTREAAEEMARLKLRHFQEKDLNRPVDFDFTQK